jgi:hypothetical protein
VESAKAVSGGKHQNQESETEGESVDNVGDDPSSGVEAQENNPKQYEADSGLVRHPAGITGENVGGKYRVDPEDSPAAVFIEHARTQQDDKESQGEAGESDTKEEL